MLDERLQFAFLDAGTDLHWRPPAEQGEIGSGLHVWKIDLRAPDAAQAMSLQTVLSADELVRFRNFKLERAATEFIVSRAAMRTIVSRYLRTQPQALVFDYGTHGKPSARDAPDLHFNLSHSDGLALLAVSRRSPVGIDLERVEPSPHHAAIAATCFTPDEVAEIAAAPADVRTEVFLRLWTRHEAILKAVGVGVGASENTIRNTGLTARTLVPATGYIAAIASI